MLVLRRVMNSLISPKLEGHMHDCLSSNNLIVMNSLINDLNGYLFFNPFFKIIIIKKKIWHSCWTNGANIFQQTQLPLSLPHFFTLNFFSFSFLFFFIITLFNTSLIIAFLWSLIIWLNFLWNLSSDGKGWKLVKINIFLVSWGYTQQWSLQRQG